MICRSVRIRARTAVLPPSARARQAARHEVAEMAKSTDRKKEQKKAPQKTAKEKKQEKRDKKK
jgi:hypothetical protein